MESCLDIKNLQVLIGNKNILFVDNFSLNCGEVVGLTGKNGAGKSTLLRVLSLIEKPAMGHVYYKQELVDNPSSLRKTIALIFQEPLLFKGSVYSNLAYPLRIRKWTKKEINDRILTLVKDFALGKLLAQDVRTLSGGEAKRVSLARALSYNPSILLLDEPFNNLDIDARQETEEKLFYYIRANNISTVFVSHRLEEIHKYCDRLVIMDNGKIKEQRQWQKTRKLLLLNKP